MHAYFLCMREIKMTLKDCFICINLKSMLVLNVAGVHKIPSRAAPSDSALNVSTYTFYIMCDLKFLVTTVTCSDKFLEIAWRIFIYLHCVGRENFTFYVTCFRNSYSFCCWPWLQLLQQQPLTHHYGDISSLLNDYHWTAGSTTGVSLSLSYLRN
jgi:hypothetical protein